MNNNLIETEAISKDGSKRLVIVLKPDFEAIMGINDVIRLGDIDGSKINLSMGDLQKIGKQLIQKTKEIIKFEEYDKDATAPNSLNSMEVFNKYVLGVNLPSIYYHMSYELFINVGVIGFNISNGVDVTPLEEAKKK